MERICSTVYEPLSTFCAPLHALFPDLLPDYELLLECSGSLSWDLVRKIGPGCTKALLVACLNKDAETFFQDPDNNPFVQFVGGRVLYDRLVDAEKDGYWGDNHLVNIIRQCMVLHALEPMATKLQCILSKVAASSSASAGTMDQSNILSSILTDPSILSSLVGLMDSPESMKTLLQSLRTIMDGMTTTATAVPETVDEEAPVVAAVSAAATPGEFIRAARQQRAKKTKQKKNKKKNANPGLSDMMALLGNMSMDDSELQDLSTELKSMDPTAIADMAREGLSSMTGVGEGVDIGALMSMFQQ